eukprot:364469-Chlamydomonas_euryale.AAC.6
MPLVFARIPCNTILPDLRRRPLRCSQRGRDGRHDQAQARLSCERLKTLHFSGASEWQLTT